jgi:hypothetical protein
MVSLLEGCMASQREHLIAGRLLHKRKRRKEEKALFLSLSYVR